MTFRIKLNTTKGKQEYIQHHEFGITGLARKNDRPTLGEYRVEWNDGIPTIFNTVQAPIIYGNRGVVANQITIDNGTALDATVAINVPFANDDIPF